MGREPWASGRSPIAWQRGRPPRIFPPTILTGLAIPALMASAGWLATTPSQKLGTMILRGSRLHFVGPALLAQQLPKGTFELPVEIKTLLGKQP